MAFVILSKGIVNINEKVISINVVVSNEVYYLQIFYLGGNNEQKFYQNDEYDSLLNDLTRIIEVMLCEEGYYVSDSVNFDKNAGTEEEEYISIAKGIIRNSEDAYRKCMK